MVAKSHAVYLNVFIKFPGESGVVVHTSDTGTPEAEFEASLIYMETSRVHREILSKRKNKERKKIAGGNGVLGRRSMEQVRDCSSSIRIQ